MPVITHPLWGLCKTPTILWILSMATLCWKLLKPVNQKHNGTISIRAASLGEETGQTQGGSLGL